MIEAGVRGDGGDVVPLRHIVRGVMLGHQHLDGGVGVPVHAVARREDMLGRDQGAPAPGAAEARVNQGHLK